MIEKYTQTYAGPGLGNAATGIFKLPTIDGTISSIRVDASTVSDGDSLFQATIDGVEIVGSGDLFIADTDDFVEVSGLSIATTEGGWLYVNLLSPLPAGLPDPPYGLTIFWDNDIPALTEYTSASASGPGSLYFAEDTDNGTNKITVTAPSSIASDATLTLPATTGTLALQSYVDSAVVGLLDDKGNMDCSANPNYPAASKGDVYTVSVAGKIGGASGVTVEVGDVFRALADNAGGTQASVGSSWAVTQANLVGAYISGGTDVAVADGGTGSSTAAGAATNLGLGTGDSPQFTAVNIGHASDTTLARASAGNLTVEGNTIYRAGGTVVGLPVELGIACSDETTAVTTGTAKATFRTPYAMTVTAVRASVTTAPTGANLVIDINESGSTILSTKLSIDATEKTSTTAATPAVISDANLADDAEITIDFDQVGSTIAGAGVKVWLIGTRA